MSKNAFSMFMALALVSLGAAQPHVTGLAGVFRSGQVFLTWNEPALGPEDTLIVFRSRTPIADLAANTCIPLARMWPKSAHDVFRNDGAGYILEEGAARTKADGLLVHTVYPGEEGSMYFAVAIKPAGAAMIPTLAAGGNALAAPLTDLKVEPIQPIWQLAAAGKPAAGAAAGKPIHLNLHPKQLATPNEAVEYLAFPDSSMGWQEGIPFLFHVALGKTSCALGPLDATFVRRQIQLDAGNKSNLIWSWWYGYNNRIETPGEMAKGTVVNYTERRVLWMIRWAQAYLKTDANRTFISGGSMAGGGGFSLGMHHPEVFAAIRSWVPNMLYNSLNEYRLLPYTGPLATMTNEGMSLSDRMNGPLYLERNKARNLPFLVVSNGRTDPSMPWANVPIAYWALNANRHAFIAAWNMGDHATASTWLAKDISYWNNSDAFDNRFALDKSYLAFSNSSANQDPGNGSAASGAQVGFMNRNLDWDPPVETASRYEVRIKLFSDTLAPAPLTCDVTVRRPQRFVFQPGAQLRASNIDAGGKVVQTKLLTVDSLGLATFPGFTITATAGNRMVLEGSPAGTGRVLAAQAGRIRLLAERNGQGMIFRLSGSVSGKRSLRICTAGGATLRTLEGGDAIPWDGRDASGKPMHGIFFARYDAGDESFTALLPGLR